jgi:hypothetical protein
MDFTKVKKSGNNKFGRVEDGTYAARIVQVIDLGIQKNEFQGEEKIEPQVMITFEFPTETVEIEGKQRPRWLSKQYKVSNHEKAALTQVILSVDPDGKTTGKGKYPEKLLGLPCMVTVGTTASGNAKVVGVSRLMKGLKVDELANPGVYFDLDSSGDQSHETFDSFPDWLKTKITEALNFHNTKFGKGSSTTDEEEFNDDPF